MVRSGWIRLTAVCSISVRQFFSPRKPRQAAMRAALYARVSTERQERQQTIDSQLTTLREWVRAEGHQHGEEHVFRDEGYSGARLTAWPRCPARRDP